MAQELPLDDLAQVAMSAYMEAAQAEGKPHKRLQAGSYAAVRAVVDGLRNAGWARPPLSPHQAAHGTLGGHAAGCRCAFCREAKSVYDKALRYHTERGRTNKVRQ